MKERRVTAETLRRDRDRRERERAALAESYDRAADVLDSPAHHGDHPEAVRRLRDEAASWRRGGRS